MFFAVFREVRKGCYSRMPLNIRVQMARGGSLEATKGGCSLRSLANRPSKTHDFLQKTSIFGKPLFCIQRWLGYLFWTSWGHPDGARGRNCTPQKKLVISKASQNKFFEASRSVEGAPQMAASPKRSITSGFRATSRNASNP